MERNRFRLIVPVRALLVDEARDSKALVAAKKSCTFIYHYLAFKVGLYVKSSN